MSFSFRSMLKKGDSSEAGDSASTPEVEVSPPPAAEAQQADAAAPQQHQPLPFGEPLFRSLGDEETGSPVHMQAGQSPFAPQGSPLTVSDVLTELPPDLVKAGSVPPEQPIEVAPQVLHSALSSGEPALPLFELYRVCPAIFQKPVAPDDTRTIRLPAAKLPALLAGAGAQPTPGAAPAPAVAAQPQAFPSAATAPASPFATALAAENGAAPSSPFGTVPAATAPVEPAPAAAAQPAAEAPRSPVSLPPRRGPDELPAQSLDPAMTQPAMQAAAPPSSPFGAAQPTPPATPASMASPFGTPAQGAPPSPFGMSPAPTEAPKESPFGAAPSEPAAEPVSQSSHKACSIQLAELTQGHSADELGFEPGMIPSWITTTFHSGIVSELHDMDRPSLDLGTIVDGVTDVGFRNVLQSARRGYKIPIPMHALAPVEGETASPAAKPTVAGTPASKPQVVQPNLETTPAAEAPTPASPFAAMKIEPGNPFAAVPDAPAAPTTEEPAPNPVPEAATEEKAPLQPAPGAAFGFPASAPAAETPAEPAESPAPPETSLPFAQPKTTSPFGAVGMSAAVDPFATKPETPSESDDGLSSQDLLGTEKATESSRSAPAVPLVNSLSAAAPAPAPEEPAVETVVEPVTQEAAPPPAVEPAPPATPAPSGGHGGLDLQPLQSGSDDQLLLRALLGSDRDLSRQEVLNLTAELPGVAACSATQGSECLSASSSEGEDIDQFRNQAAKLADSLQTLAPLIGIADAETFSLNSEQRLMTFCFPGELTLSVLHEGEPSSGLRDKLTLIARQLQKLSGD